LSKTRIGIIGYGSWTKKALLPVLVRDGRADILSIAARTEKTRRLIQQEMGPGIHVFDGIESLLDGPVLDAVMIAVPDSMHEHTLTAALNAGIAVFYEPPVKTNAAV